jgi:cytochrome b6-f complex iron-sulfur subunit
MKDDPQTRRQFCSRACSAAALAALGTAVAATLESCTSGAGGPTSPGISFSNLPQVTGTANGSASISVNVAGTALANTGTLALVRSSIGDVLVARTGDATFSALSSACTHAACEITGFSGQVFVCPCHGSQFDASGRVVGGPAPASLRQYTTQFANGVLTISA